MIASPRALVALLSLSLSPLAAQLPADWKERDLEGRWVAYRTAVDDDTSGTATERWAKLLAELRDAELLEWIAIHEGFDHAGNAMARIDAPQLIRAAVWNLQAFDSHARDGARKMLMQHGPRVLGWFERYPAAASGEAAAALLDALRGAGVTPAPVETDLPPLDPMQVLVPWLDAPAELAVFGDRKTAEPRTRYRHQVVRALGALLVRGDRDPRVITKVVRLTSHGDEVVRRAAFDTIAKLPPGIIPVRQLRRILDDGGADPARRRSAAVVLSFASHPDALRCLVAIAADPAHVAYDVVRERLAEVADPIALDPLRAAEPASPAHAEQLRALFEAVDRRGATKAMFETNTVWRMALRIAWLEDEGDPTAADVRRRTTELLRAVPADSAALAHNLLNQPPPLLPFDGERGERIAAAMRAYLESLHR